MRVLGCLATLWMLTASMGCGCRCPPAAPSAPAQAPTPASPAAADPPTQSGTMLRQASFNLGLVVMGRETNAPLIEVTLNGVRAKAILDTGAEMSVIQQWFLDEAGVTPRGDEEASITDSSKVKRTASLATIAAEFGSWGSVEQPMVVIPSVPMLAESRIGIIVNPMFLAREGFGVRLNFPEGTMQELEALSPETDVDIQTCLTSSHLAKGMTVRTHRQVVEASVAGVATSLQIDSGARTTVLVANADAVAKVADLPSQDEEARGVFGSEKVTSIADRVDVVVGDSTFAISGIRIGPSEKARASCKDEGLLGMDVLKYCTVELALTGTRLRCNAPN